MSVHLGQPSFDTFRSIRKLAEDAFSVDYLALVDGLQGAPGDIRVVKVFHSGVSAERVREWLRLHSECTIPLLPRVGAELQPGVFEMSVYREPVFSRQADFSKAAGSRQRPSHQQEREHSVLQLRALTALADTLRWMHSFGSVHGQLSADSLVIGNEGVLLLGAGIHSLREADARQRTALLEEDWAAFLELCDAAGVLGGALSPDRLQLLREGYAQERDFECYGEVLELLLFAAEGATGQSTTTPTPHSSKALGKVPQLVQRFVGQLPSFLQQYLPSFGGAGSSPASAQKPVSADHARPAKTWIQPLIVATAVFVVLLLVFLPAGGATDSSQHEQNISSQADSTGAAGEQVLTSGGDTQTVIDDPLRAAEHLLEQRAECYRLSSAECLRVLYEPGASGYYRDAQQLVTGASPQDYADIVGLEMVQRNGDLALLSSVNETSPTHVHLLKVTGAGWLLRDIYRLDSKI